LSNPPAEPLDVTLDGRRLTTFFLRAGKDRRPRPVIITVNGYDASVSDMYLAMGHQALERGYHVVLVDGPGQGSLLVRDGVPLIPRWERVIRAVVDAVGGRSDVDRKRIVLQGWSLGGHLSLRGATGEARLAACVSDPPAWSILMGIIPAAAQLGLSPEAAARLPEISDADLATMTAAIEANPRLGGRSCSAAYGRTAPAISGNGSRKSLPSPSTGGVTASTVPSSAPSPTAIPWRSEPKRRCRGSRRRRRS
jgi:pimeloyl-ACP methyl ester carboxylesterase